MAHDVAAGDLRNGWPSRASVHCVARRGPTVPGATRSPGNTIPSNTIPEQHDPERSEGRVRAPHRIAAPAGSAASGRTAQDDDRQ